MKRKRLCLKVLLAACAFGTIYIFFLADKFPKESNSEERKPRGTSRGTPNKPNIHHVTSNAPTVVKKTKQILIWNDIFGRYHPWGWKSSDQQGFKAAGCRITNCKIHNYRSRMSQADAVVFHIPTLNNDKPKLAEGERNINQRWVYLNHESPCCKYGDDYMPQWNGEFNWTMTYRLDADIPMFYGQFCKRSVPAYIDYDSILQEKRKFAAIISSNCGNPFNSQRWRYLTLLQKHLKPHTIDIFGKCGNATWCSRKNDEECVKTIAKEYKFYLAFENAFAMDYVTEKLYKWLPYNIVPVVRGGGRFKNPLVAPPHSVIHTSEFDSPQSLARYLKLLDRHNDGYINYLKWKEQYRATFFEPDAMQCSMQEHSFCKLCAMLHENTESKVYQSVHSWWSRMCFKVIDL